MSGITRKTSTTVRPTLKSTNERIDAIDEKLDLIVEFLVAGQPKQVKAVEVVKGEVVEPTKKGKKAKKVKAEVVGTTIEGKRCLTQANRVAFIADHEWAATGTSTRRLAEMVLNEGFECVGNWAIGPRRTEQITGTKPEVVTVTVAKAKADEAAKPKRTKAQRKAAKAIGSAPRRANGTISPKCEWEIRETLALSGGLTPAQIDKKVRKAYKDPEVSAAFGLVNA